MTFSFDTANFFVVGIKNLNSKRSAFVGSFCHATTQTEKWRILTGQLGKDTAPVRKFIAVICIAGTKT